MKKGKWTVLGILVAAVLLTGFWEAGHAVYTWSRKADTKTAKYTVVVDPGHGGADPGKVGVNDAYEKDINLSIALLLKEILEQNDCRVILTRDSDAGLYQEGDSNKKMTDLRKRCQIIDESGADVTVSIHQNSFPQESSKGAQVFYQTTSSEGKILADTLQRQLISSLDEENRRVAKANSDYYMLKHTKGIMVIVECGFLSNWEEAKLLTQENYQRRVAWAVALGTLQYLSTNGEERTNGDENTKDSSGKISGSGTAGGGGNFTPGRSGSLSYRDGVRPGGGRHESGGGGENLPGEGEALG